MMRNYRMLPSQPAVRRRLEPLVTGLALLNDPMLNRDTAFTPEQRQELDLVGLLPSEITTLDEQVKRAYAQYQQQGDDPRKNVFLTALQDRNEMLFYRLLAEHLNEMLPVVYDPTVAVAIEQYSHEYRRPRGVYLSIDRPDAIEASFRDVGAGPDDIDLIVATDAEEILGKGQTHHRTVASRAHTSLCRLCGWVRGTEREGITPRQLPSVETGRATGTIPSRLSRK
jgi:hypothetical protein